MLQQSREASWACSPTVETVGIVCLHTEYHLLGFPKINNILERKPYQAQLVFMRARFPGQSEICGCLFLWRKENRRTRGKTLRAEQRTNKLDSHGTELESLVEGESSHHFASLFTLGFASYRKRLLWALSIGIRKRKHKKKWTISWKKIMGIPCKNVNQI